MGKIERPPSWILKYKERIDKRTITVEDILEEENKTREKPIKISSVTRALNAMGYPITELRREKKAEAEETKAEVEEEEEEKKPVEERERGPGWLQKYRERIEKGTITVEDILEEENEIREAPIKLSTVTRALNSMGYPITELRRGKKVEVEVKEGEGEEKKPVEKREGTERIERGPGWLQKYRERIEKGTITVEDILEEENEIRAVPIKISTVTRALNSLGYPITGLRRGKREVVEAGVSEEKKKVEKPIEEREKGPGWLQKYRERIEKGTITVEDILEEENEIRAVPIKISSVTRALNSMGYQITGLRRERTEEVKRAEQLEKAGMAEGIVYSSSIGKISEETEKRFNVIKKSWEKDLGKSLHNDYFVNILLALAKLVEHGKTLAPVKR